MTYSETFDLRAPAQKVFEAFLDESLLCGWLAEHARVEPEKGGAFRFWGRDVIWCGSEADSEGEILELDAPRNLAFSWRWKGHPSRVSVRISENGSDSRLAIEHAFESFDPTSNGPGPDMAGCLWRIAIGNLTNVLETGHAALRPDYTAEATAGDRVELEIEIAAPCERVFRALMDPEQVRVWMQIDAPEIDADANRYSYGWTRGTPAREVGPTRILEIVPNECLVFDWHWPDEGDGRVRWELTPSKTGTTLRLVHTNSTAIANVLGWSDAMVCLRRLVEDESD